MEEECEEDCLLLPKEHGTHMAPALIALHPQDLYVVVAVGASLRIFDLKNNVSVTTKDQHKHVGHGGAIRALKFEKEGKFLATAGDDKKVKLWQVGSFQCVKTIHSSKKVSAIAFSQCSQYLMFADKFGVVYAITTKIGENVENDINEKPMQLFGHCCSIITGLECSSEMKFIVSSDRDFKIRITKFPKEPLLGAHEIHTFCLAHTSFVSCVTFVGGKNQDKALLVSGGGDSTIRLWDYENGDLLDTFIVKGLAEKNGGGEETNGTESTTTVISMAVAPCGSVLAAAIESLEGILVMRCDFPAKKLIHLQKLVFEQHTCPTSLQFDQAGNIWAVAGAAATIDLGDRIAKPEEIAASETKAQALSATASVRVVVIRNAAAICTIDDHVDTLNNGLQYTCLQDGSVPGGELLLETLQGTQANFTVAINAAEAAKLSMKNLLSKRQFSFEQREQRKCKRNDRVLKGNTNNCLHTET